MTVATMRSDPIGDPALSNAIRIQSDTAAIANHVADRSPTVAQHRWKTEVRKADGPAARLGQ